MTEQAAIGRPDVGRPNPTPAEGAGGSDQPAGSPSRPPAVELGAALRAWRDRLAPESVGLTRTGRRRVPGLRRQELAQLSGVSRDYLVQLEQGRAPSPSSQVLSALASTLLLTDAERAHLFRLARHPLPADGRAPGILPSSIRRLVARASRETPVAVYDPQWSPVAWNPLWARVNGDPGQRPRVERNLVWRQFMDLPMRVVRSAVESEAFESLLVADLRSSSSRYEGEPRFARLVRELYDRNPRFRALWDDRRVDTFEGEKKVIRHPTVGCLHVECDVHVLRDTELRLVLYTAEPGSPTARRLTDLSSEHGSGVERPHLTRTGSADRQRERLHTAAVVGPGGLSTRQTVRPLEGDSP